MDEHLQAHDQHGPTPVHVDVHHEETDINVRAVLIGSAIFIVFSILMLLLLWGTYELFLRVDRKFDPEAVSAIPAAADRQDFVYGNVPADKPDFTNHWTVPIEELDQFRKSELEILERYGESGTAGVVRVPIEAAKDLALRRGYPVRTDAAEAMSEVRALGAELPEWASSGVGAAPQTSPEPDTLMGEAIERAEEQP
ncbi:MAG: hypothetical protein KY459_11575 [Acidobacteria bacterium]|nr:hypothetical protein [Acidobacteriota bacterium]